MRQKRKQYSSDFKAKVALAVIRGDETVPQLAARHGLHPLQGNTWKRQLTEQAAELFSRDKGRNKEDGHSADDLHRVIGQLTVERLWRTVKYEHLYTRAFANVGEVRQSLTHWFDWYNQQRFHQGLDNLTPDEVYCPHQTTSQAAWA